MSRLLSWLAREPVRARLYGAGVAGVTLLVLYGLLSDTQGVAWLGLVAALLGVPAVESARAKVTPTPTPGEVYGEFPKPEA